MWGITLFLRTTNVMNNDFFSFILGIMPNFAAVFGMFGVFIVYYELLFKRKFEKKNFIFMAIVALVCFLISEVIHEVFLNSKFDILDIIASAIAIIIFYFLLN